MGELGLSASSFHAAAEFFDSERRYNYTTPKTFLELIKLYKNVLLKKRKQTQDNIDRLENGLVRHQLHLFLLAMIVGIGALPATL